MATLRLGDVAPDFEQESSLGRIRFHEWLGSGWGVLFSHPADFTPVCTTELGLTAKLREQFAQRGVKVIALSVDPDLIHPTANTTATVRSLFVIDPAKKIRLVITYPASTGRNFEEILRVIDSLQLTDNHSVATPGNWRHGEDVVIVPSLQDPEKIKEKFPKGFVAVRPYLRITPQPNLHH
jgi:alkyl hydroperoxide reductase subunit AhpC